MKQKYLSPKMDKDEIEILSEQLDPAEIQTLMYLRGFNRSTLREWSKKGLMDFSMKYY